MLSDMYRRQMEDLVKFIVAKGYLPENGQNKEAFEKDFQTKLIRDITDDQIMYAAAMRDGDIIHPSDRWGYISLSGISSFENDVLFSFKTTIRAQHAEQQLSMTSFYVLEDGLDIVSYEIAGPETLPHMNELFPPYQQKDQTDEKIKSVKNKERKRSKRKDK